MMERSYSGWQPMPVTAIASLDDTFIILAAKGSYVHVLPNHDRFDGPKSSGLRYQIFKNQPIHGLARFEDCDHVDPIFAAWGGSCIRFFSIASGKLRNDLAIDIAPATDQAGRVRLSFLCPPLILSGWIVACRPMPSSDHDELAVAALTASNEAVLVMLPLRQHVGETYEPSLFKPVIRTLAKVRDVLLYCGHMILDGEWLVIASGTVFGQVLVWKTSVRGLQTSSLGLPVTIASFHKHEGSVFGVQILKRNMASDSSYEYRIASCSDDRTVRVYDVAQDRDESLLIDHTVRTGFAEISHLSSAATINVGVSSMSAHLSRIWSVRWLSDCKDESLLLSFGEDTTTQVWRVHNDTSANGAPESCTLLVDSAAAFGFHFGKNIWAETLEPATSDSSKVVLYTGGADGRLVGYELSRDLPVGKHIAQRFILSQPDVESQATAGSELGSDGEESLFKSLAGEWSLHRIIDSKRSEYPSGTFDGRATLTQREVTDPVYDGEMLYSEEGTFAITTGWSFPARRSYVYRYQRSTKKITAWFVKPEDSDTVDYLFHQVEFRDQEASKAPQSAGSSSATGYHLCVRDHYNASYTFRKDQTSLTEWTLSYHVTGPEKDYTAASAFTRLEATRPNPLILPSPATARVTKPTKADAFRGYCWLYDRRFLVTSDNGDVLIADIDNSGAVLTSTGHGGSEDVHLAKLMPRRIANIPSLSSYSLTSSLGSLGAIMADGFGSLHLLRADLASKDLSDLGSMRILCTMESKITFMHAQEVTDSVGIAHFVVIFQCLKREKMWILRIGVDKVLAAAQTSDPEHLFRPVPLELPPGFILTSAAYDWESAAIACGSRHGSFCAWSLTESSDNLQSLDQKHSEFQNLHGKDTITTITFESLPQTLNPIRSNYGVRSCASKCSSSVFTTGRDGTVKRHILHNVNGLVKVQTVSSLSPPFGPNIEGLQLYGGRVVVWGFHGTSFILWDLTRQQELFRVRCGNCHRNWAFKMLPSLDGPGGALVWTQANKCNLRYQPKPSHHLLMNGGHGREIKAMDSMEASDRQGDATTGQHQRLVATGAEDTDIRLFEATWQGLGATQSTSALSAFRTKPSYRCVATLIKHETGLTALRFVPAYSLLLSAGSKEEFHVWRVRPRRPLPDVICIGTCPRVTEDGDLRLTDFAVYDPKILPENGMTEEEKNEDEAYVIVSVVYSDSSIRMWRLTVESGKLTLLTESHYSTNCLTCVQYIQILHKPRLVVASTDGHIAIYAMPALEGGQSDDVNAAGETSDSRENRGSAQKLLWHRVHQSSIKSLEVVELSDNDALIVTGGDDNALAFTRIKHIQRAETGGKEHSVDEPEDFTSSLDPDASPQFQVSTVLVPKAHAGAINDIKLLESTQIARGAASSTEGSAAGREKDWSLQFATTSSDQRVRVWQVSIEEGVDGETYGMHLSRRSIDSDVADASCLDAYDGFVVVAGVGMEVLGLV